MGRPAGGERAAVLERAADLIEARRFELGALEVLEAAKPWIEADADISEAVDFCRYYASEMRELAAPRHPGGARRARRPGVDAARGRRRDRPVELPARHPLRLTAAPLVAGNAVIMKPAEQTTVIAAALMDILAEAGVPPASLNFVPGMGEDVGARLVAHPGSTSSPSRGRARSAAGSGRPPGGPARARPT
jgi:RHH-type transcriptional regulator, proline utilization regulon repressor / proline dehydrogenase / delta 1-pyrroline-5-carboxylate dehydrogenase